MKETECKEKKQPLWAHGAAMKDKGLTGRTSGEQRPAGDGSGGWSDSIFGNEGEE